MYGCEADSLFCFKAMMKRAPFGFNFVLLIIAVVLFGHAIRVCESPLTRIDNQMDFQLMSESMWSVVVTMTTCKLFFYFKWDMEKFTQEQTQGNLSCFCALWSALW